LEGVQRSTWSDLQNSETLKTSSEAIDFLEVQEHENLEAMHHGYSILMGFAPEASETLIIQIRNLETKDYVRKDAIRDYFQTSKKEEQKGKLNRLCK
tara:strand:+ start:99 stop:389 length:291 start_codon:yes stop_codon:yes gene_type:complete